MVTRFQVLIRSCIQTGIALACGLVLFISFTPMAGAVAPVVVNFSPADNSDGAARSTNLVVTFDQTVIASGSTLATPSRVRIFKSDGTLVESINASGSQVTISGAEATIDPSSDLAKNTAFYVQIETEAFVNASDETYAGISDTTTWSFRTIGGGAATNRAARQALLDAMPTYYNTEPPSLSDVGIFVPQQVASGTSSSTPSTKKQEHTAAPEENRNLSSSVLKAIADRAARMLKPAAPTTNVRQKFESPLHERACARVQRRFAGNRKMIDRVNARLQKRFGFTCNL